MQYSVVNYQEVIKHPDSRLDAEYYKPEFLNFYSKISHYQRLGDFIVEGYRVVYENTNILDIDESERDSYTRFIQASDIETPQINWERVGFVDDSDWHRYPKGRIKPGEILIEVKGKAQKVAMVMDDAPLKTLVTGSLYKLTVSEKLPREYLLAYLICKYGTAFKDRNKTNLLISFINKSSLYDIPVPIFSKQFHETVAHLVKKSHKYNKQAQHLYNQAEQRLLAELGLLDWRPQHQLSFVRNYSEVEAVERFDAEYFQPKYYEALDMLKSAKPLEIKPLGSLITKITNGHTPRYHDLSQGSIIFLTAEHVSDFQIDFESQKRILKEHHDGELSRTKLRANDLLITIKGRIGNAAVVDNVSRPTNINQDVALLRLIPEIHSYYVVGFLNSILGKALVEQMSTGQINPFLSLGGLRQIPIPIFDLKRMNELGNKVQDDVSQAHEAKIISSQLLNLAKTAVEQAIEQDEAIAEIWLREQVAALGVEI